MKNLFVVSFAFFLAVVPVFLTGCKPTSPAGKEPAASDSHSAHQHEGHEHHDHADHGQEKHPETYAEAIEQLERLHAAIRDAFANNDKDAAHDPLHHVGHLLEDVAELAEKASLDEEQLKTVKKAQDALFDGYTEIDGMFHGSKEVKYEDLAPKLDAALAQLKSVLKPDTSQKKETSEETTGETPEKKTESAPKKTPEKK